MARYTGPKCKLFRRESINIFEPNTSKYKAFAKKSYPPGMHGQKGSTKMSEYAKQLREKQKAKKIYGILEKQFKKYYEVAVKSKEITGEYLMKLCEKRLDNTLFRAGLARTRPQARQMVNHGIFLVNNRRVNIPSIQVNKNDIIEPREKAKSFKLFSDLEKKKHYTPKWLKLDSKTLKIEVIGDPAKEDLEKSIDNKLIIEYYSK